MRKALYLIVAFGLLTPAGAGALPLQVGDAVTIGLSSTINSDPANRWPDIGGYGGLFTLTNSTTGVAVPTFCLELDEYVSLGTKYYVTDVSDDIASGGGRNTDDGDQLSGATKWLYSQFLQTPSDYNAAAVQLAVWVLEDEYADKADFNWNDWGATGAQALSYYNLAIDNANLAPSNIFVVDLVDAQGGRVQSYLIAAPVPEPATMLLLGSGLLGLAWLRRKLGA